MFATLDSVLDGYKRFGCIDEPGYSLMKKLHMQVQQTGEQLIEVFCDSDWGGNRATRQSTTSVMVFMNSILCFSYSRGQKSIALSSCEAEVLAATSAGSEALLIKTLWEFICNRVAILELRSDSSSGRQWLQRSGVGRMKHFQIRLCWIQSAIRNGEFGIFPIGTQLNVADLEHVGSNVSRKKCFQALLIAQMFGGGRGADDVNVVMENKQHVWWWTGFYTCLCISVFAATIFSICIFFWMGRRMWLHLEERLERMVHEMLENEREMRRDVLALHARGRRK